MNKTATVLRNSLIALALGAAVPAAWADNAHPASAAAYNQGFKVPAKSSELPPLPKRLDLRAPDIRDVMSADELYAALPNPDEVIVGDDGVSVHGAPPPPYVPGGFAALYWGATHPASAWRILAPVQ